MATSTEEIRKFGMLKDEKPSSEAYKHQEYKESPGPAEKRPYPAQKHASGFDRLEGAERYQY